MHIFLTFFLVLAAFLAQAQRVERKTIDVGTVRTADSVVARVEVYNNTKSALHYLPVFNHTSEVHVRIENNGALPGQSLIVHLQYLPTKQGKFKVPVSLTFSTSASPMTLTLTGNMQGPLSQYVKDCTPPPGAPSASQASTTEIEVVEAGANRSVSRATVHFVDHTKRVNGTTATGHTGKVVETLPGGSYRFTATASGYDTVSLSQDIYNRNGFTNKVRIEINRTEERKPAVQVPNLTLPPVLTRPWPQAQRTVPLLDSEAYLPNNIVFVVDVSGSMNYGDRLGLMKRSMHTCMQPLRAFDSVAIITFAARPKVLMNTTSAEDQEKLRVYINDLNASGSTAGGNAVVMAYEEAKKSFIPGGNNIVIVATDGAFNMGMSDSALIEFLKAERASGIKMSIVLFGKSPVFQAQMQVLADAAGGHLIQIGDATSESQEYLLEEVKAQSRRQGVAVKNEETGAGTGEE